MNGRLRRRPGRRWLAAALAGGAALAGAAASFGRVQSGAADSRLQTQAAAGASLAGPESGSGEAGVVAITGGTVHTLGPAGKIENATVLIAGGRIRAVGRDVAVPAGALQIDATGKVVTPGLFDSLTRLGLVEVNQVDATEDSVNGDLKLTAAFDVAQAINPRSMLIPINRVEGITRAVVAPTPTRSLFAGQAAVIHLGGDHDLVVRPSVAVFAVLGERAAEISGGSRAAALARLREALADTLDYLANRASYERAARRPYALSRLDLEALVPVVRGERPLVVLANQASDIEAALALARDFKLRLILAEASEAWKVAPQIAAAQVPVVINPLRNLPSSFERLGATLANAARLHQAGVLLAFATEEAHNSRNLKQEAGNAVAYGLPWDAALAAMTINPARIWGVADRVGSLDPGKDADVVVWSGDPLEVTVFAERVFIRGVEMPAETRQTKLRDRYKSLPVARPSSSDR